MKLTKQKIVTLIEEVLRETKWQKVKSGTPTYRFDLLSIVEFITEPKRPDDRNLAMKKSNLKRAIKGSIDNNEREGIKILKDLLPVELYEWALKEYNRQSQEPWN